MRTGPHLGGGPGHYDRPRPCRSGPCGRIIGHRQRPQGPSAVQAHRRSDPRLRPGPEPGPGPQPGLGPCPQPGPARCPGPGFPFSGISGIWRNWPGRDRNDGPWVCFFGSEFRLTPQRGPGGAMPPAGPGPGIPAFRAFGAARRQALGGGGTLHRQKPRRSAPASPRKTLRDPPHSQGNAPMGHRWSISRVGLALFIPMRQRRFAGTDGCCQHRIHGTSMR